MNVVILTGRLIRDPVSRTSANGTEISKFTIAVPKPFKDKNGKDADFIDVTAFSGQAKVVNEHMRKGSKVQVVGEITNNDYTTKEGVKVYTYDIIARNVEFGESKNEEIDWFKAANDKYAKVDENGQ